MPYNFLLRMLDRYALSVEVKGGSVPLRATKFIFTSNTPPTEWYRLENMPYGGDPFHKRTTPKAEGGRWDCQVIHTGEEAGDFLGGVLDAIAFWESKQEAEGVDA